MTALLWTKAREIAKQLPDKRGPPHRNRSWRASAAKRALSHDCLMPRIANLRFGHPRAPERFVIDPGQALAFRLAISRLCLFARQLTRVVVSPLERSRRKPRNAMRRQA
jgi:hypothetical protein